MAQQKKTYSLEPAVVAAVEREARIQNIPMSTYVNRVLRRATQEDDAKRLGRALSIRGEPNGNLERADKPETL